MVVDLFLVYQFIRRLATPFEKWPAYEAGVIDGNGNILIKKKDRLLVSQRKSFGIFDLMILKLKKLLGKVPGGKTRLASYAAAIWLIKEWKHFSEDSLLNESVTEKQIDESLELFLIRYNHYNTLVENVNGNLIEKLKATDDMGKWIDDFQKSDAPQFKGKSKEKRRQMAIAAKYGAERDVGLREWVCGQCNCEPCICENDGLDELSLSVKDLERLKKGLKKENLEEVAAIARWKKAGPNGEIQATIGGKKYQIEKSLDHNERHKGEWKVMVWDKRKNSWEWETTEYGKANAKAWIVDRMNEEPTNTVGGGAIAGMDAGHMSKAAQKKWVQSNKRKRKTIRDIMKGGLV